MQVTDTECIILAGGLGTRLRGVIGKVPKCMAPVAGKPFLHYLFQYLAEQGCTRVVLSLGYRHEVVLEWLNAHQAPFSVSYVIEEEPLGTGGGIALALKETTTEQVFVLNGDTFFDVDLAAMLSFHLATGAGTDCTIALKSLRNFSRYGTVQTGERGRLLRFEEKQPKEEGLINGGVYLLNTVRFAGNHWPGRAWSFEKDYLERCDYTDRGTNAYTFYGYRGEGYFIDIGVPDDYVQAAHDFPAIFAGA